LRAGTAQTASRVARPLELLELLRDLQQAPIHARELLAHAPDVGARREVEQVQAPLRHALDGVGQPPRPAVQLRDNVEVRVAVHGGLDGTADGPLEAEDQLEPEGQVGGHDAAA
jgi:hypothetical protein